MPRCFIHIGTHKTGTTSLQYVLSTQSDRLNRLGYLYPKCGRPPVAPYGHHNIAWQISNDPRFSAECGTIDTLLEEIVEQPGDIVLSSEDFECSAHASVGFTSFVGELRRRGWEVIFVVYLRNQIEYAESLYLTMVRLGLDAPFPEFLDKIVASGEFRWKSWIFAFDYDEFLSGLKQITGTELVVRSFDTARKQNGLVQDFMSVVGIAGDDLAGLPDVQLNERISISDAAESFYVSYLGRALKPSEKSALSLICGSQFAAGMIDRSKLRLSERFALSNERVARSFGLPASALTPPFEASDNRVRASKMEDIFSGGSLDAIKAS